MLDIYKYDVALSHTNEDRLYVKEVAIYLINHNIKVYYDEFYQADGWGKPPIDYLDQVFREQSLFTVIFISKRYQDDLSALNERKIAQTRAFNQDKEYILPVRFDDTDIPGLNMVKCIDLREKTPMDLGKLIIKKINLAKGEKIEINPRNQFKVALARNCDRIRQERIF